MSRSVYSILTLLLALLSSSCGDGKGAGKEALIGKWLGSENQQDQEFREDGTLLTYKHGETEPSRVWKYEIEKANHAVMRADTDEMRITFQVSEDGQTLKFAFTHDFFGKPVKEEDLHYITLRRDSGKAGE